MLTFKSSAMTTVPALRSGPKVDGMMKAPNIRIATMNIFFEYDQFKGSLGSSTKASE
jgi:hypothetical protein